MQEVIIYRSPAEAVFWHSIQSGDGMVANIFFAAVIFIVTFVGLHYACTKYLKMSQFNSKTTYIPMSLAAVAGLGFLFGAPYFL